MLSNTDINRTDKVWFYDMKADGYTLNNKRVPIEDNDIPDIIRRYHTRLETELDRARTDQSFFITRAEIVENNYNLALNKYKEVELEDMDYNDYTGITFEDLITQINNGRPDKKFVETPNSIYIPKLGTSNPVCSASELVIKEQNYYQIVLKDIVLNNYLAAMFKSVLGQSLLASASNGGVISKINKSNLIQITVPVPDMDVQRQIVGTIDKITILKGAIDKFDKELALNPVSSIKVIDRLDQLVEILGELTDADYIRNIIRKGESKVVEFKETFGYDVRNDKKEKHIETFALKTIIGFLNTDGGVLLIGVNDEGLITGVDYEIKKFFKSNDKYLLNFKNRIKTQIGEEHYPLINYRLSNVDGKTVLIVECIESDKPCYLDGSDFYVRTNPATDKLSGPKLVEYVRTHFKLK